MLIQYHDFFITEVISKPIFLLYGVSLLVDIITGNAVALTQRKWNSKTGINGTIRHVGLFSVMVLLLPMISFTTGMDVIANVVMLYVIGQYTISILENLSAIGFDMNESFAKYFEFLGSNNKEAKQENKKENEKL